MTSAERVIEYIDLTPEQSETKISFISIPTHWPIGAITFDNLSFRYSSTSPWVLKNISINIQPSEKVYFIDFFSINLFVDMFRLVLLVELVPEKVQLFNHYFVWLN